jgi:hypothetical protein
MPRINLEQFLTKDYDRGLMVELVRQLEDAINKLSEGRIYQTYNATSAEPSGANVSHQVGDVVRNSLPTELGSAGSKYVLYGWLCLAAGSPGTFRELRIPTGN